MAIPVPLDSSNYQSYCSRLHCLLQSMIGIDLMSQWTIHETQLGIVTSFFAMARGMTLSMYSLSSSLIQG